MKKLFCVGVIAMNLVACASDRAITSPHPDGACDKKLDYNINFNRFDEVAQQIAHGTGCFIETNTSVTGAIKPNPVQGNFTPREAVKLAIQGTSLKIAKQAPNLIKVE